MKYADILRARHKRVQDEHEADGKGPVDHVALKNKHSLQDWRQRYLAYLKLADSVAKGADGAEPDHVAASGAAVSPPVPTDASPIGLSQTRRS